MTQHECLHYDVSFATISVTITTVSLFTFGGHLPSSKKLSHQNDHHRPFRCNEWDEAIFFSLRAISLFLWAHFPTEEKRSWNAQMCFICVLCSECWKLPVFASCCMLSQFQGMSIEIAWGLWRAFEIYAIFPLFNSWANQHFWRVKRCWHFKMLSVFLVVCSLLTLNHNFHVLFPLAFLQLWLKYAQ